MEKRVVLLLLFVSVGLTEAAGCISTTSPQCYKNSTGKEEDFNCTWVESNLEQNPTYTLNIWDKERKSFIIRVNTGRQAQKYLLLEELGTISRKMEIWVQRKVGNHTCISNKTSVILECSVKYSAPRITSMKRSAGILNLTLDKPKDNKSAIYEIKWRARDSEWQTETFETKDSTIQDFYRLQLQNQTVYQVQLRRQARLLLHPCNDSLHTLWSDWSPTVDVPLEIRLLPGIRWVEKQRNGSRDVNLTWDAPPAEESVGGVTYKLTLSIWPCEKPRKVKPINVNRTIQTSITMSEARVSIIAVNKVGSSPPHLIIIPAVKHLKECPKPQRKNITYSKKTCLEWYKLEDGENRPTTVKSSSHKLFKDIEKSREVKKFVRHYYFLHTMTKKHFQTQVMCPFYSEEGVPTKGPENVSFSDVTHESAVVRWVSIPVVQQQGFLQQYMIWISEQGNTKHHQVLANETSFLIKNLHPGTFYTVSIAGRTKAGAGPNSTVNFETQSSKDMALSWQDQTILSVCVVALLCTIICSIAARRFRNKLLPVVPSPMIAATEFNCPHDQDLSNVTEEVHDVILLQVQDLKARKNVPPEKSILLQEFGLVVFEEEDEEDEEEGVTDLGFMKSCCYPNPSYRGQMLQLPEPIHMTDNTYKDNDTESTYRNGLFFETRVLECDQTSL
ncbi:leukemia inhibitory factor receptor-like isoform X1 [Myxocyprinus asiaticus]|uniref:leukemia inhibitory factor receptor-like isoform X1 n=1 Tax=Myxocyprinus asiaticus TaxID=70543 RepID=UPI002221645E|nr:leukemia inhibitory factor receptor-like isoform X1 [Myxocyprinus asiaticus]